MTVDAQPNLSLTQINDFPFNSPTFPEQIKIWTFRRRLTIYNSQLFKKGLFIAEDVCVVVYKIYIYFLRKGHVFNHFSPIILVFYLYLYTFY